MPIASGIYIITNAHQLNPVFLENPNDEEPIQGHYKPDDASERTQAQWHWRVTDLKNECHLIQNVEHKRYANCGSRAGLNAHVKGASEKQEWRIQETRCKGEYTIGTIDGPNFWMLPDKGKSTPVELFNRPGDRKCWWTFTDVETGALAKEDTANPAFAFLFELTLMPILPFSPLRLDFVIIQQKSDDSVANASRIMTGLCSPLVSSRRPQSDALCVHIIEFTSDGLDIFFQRSYDVVTFEKLRNLGGPDISWKWCGNVSSLPKMAMRGLRANATKMAVLSLDITLLQQGSQAIIKLINHLARHDITLILTSIQPTWERAFSDSAVSKELKKISSEYRRFEQEGEFSDYVVNYNEMVALPRLAEYPELRDAIFQTVPKIVDMLRGNRDEAETSASALVELAAHAHLRHVICQTIPHIVEMLKDRNHDTRLIVVEVLRKFTEHTELHDAIFRAVLKMVEVFTVDNRGAEAATSALVKLAEHAEPREVGTNFSDGAGCASLAWAAEKNYYALVRILLAQNDVRVDDRNDRGRTPLSLAAEKGHEAVMRLLLAHEGVDANCKDDYGETPLSWAARNGHEAVVRVLLAQEGVRANSGSNSGRNPLSWAAGNGHEAVVRLLVAHESVDANSKDNLGRTPLLWAAEKGHEAVVRLLLAQEGVDANYETKSGRTPLSWAAESGHEAVVRLLLAQEGVDANSRSYSGRTPLSWAAENGHEAVVRALLAQEGVDADSKDNYFGGTPLLWAAENGHEAVVRLLLAQEGVDANSKTKSGRTPLSWAAESGYEAVVRLLLAHEGVDADSKDNYFGGTPLMWAAENGHEVVVRLLLAQEGVDANYETKSGQTPLSWAVESGHEAVVRLLLAQEGVDANSKDNSGQTSLSWAAENGHEAVVRLLLAQEGVDANSKDNSGQTSLSLAAENGHEAVVRLLLAQEGVDANSRSYSGRTPLSWAAENGHEAVVRLLVAQEGVDTNSKDNGGRTPLLWAARCGKDAVVCLLLAQKGVDANSKDNRGQTPRELAATNGHEAVVCLLPVPNRPKSAPDQPKSRLRANFKYWE